MAVMLIESTDPNFSRYLKKNPATGMTIKSMRHGVVSGWYPNGNTQSYALWFREVGAYNSFSNEEGRNYLDLTQYASTYFVFNVISQFFNSTLKFDDTQPCSGVVHKIAIPNVQLRSEKTFTHLCMMLEPGIFEIRKKTNVETDAIYSVTIHSDGTFNEFMMRVYLLFYLLHADHYENDIVYMEGMIAKVIGMMQELRCPYFVWYWFKKNILVKHNFFKEYVTELGIGSCDGTINMEYGDTQKQRKTFVDSILSTFKVNDVLDVGCGGGYYLLPYAKAWKEKDNGQIVGVDIDTRIVANLRTKLTDRKWDTKISGEPNATVVTSLDDVPISTGYDHGILCIEVIEHMPNEEAKELLIKLIKRNPKYIILTTPNFEFNRYYGTMLTKYRHEDHHFELNDAALTEFIDECLQLADGQGYRVDSYKVGDTVDGIPVTLGRVIYREDV